MRKQNVASPTAPSRRDFIKASSLLVAGGAVGTGLGVASAAHAYGSDEIRIGLIGCGGRGTGAVQQALNTATNPAIRPNGAVKLVALADVFPDRLQAAYRSIKGQHSELVDVPQERQFSGLDAYQHLLACDLDLVILATPPGFRPLHFEAAVRAGKHVFLEKPLATDPPGVRRVLAANEEAKQRELLVAVGLQRRHEKKYQETIRRLWDGAIGELVCLRVYWNGGGVWVRPRHEAQTELEYQLRNWYYFNWIGGDHIVEQHIHNLDVGNWLLKDHPAECHGMGGRQVRTGKEYGQIYDHHCCEFTYPNGVKMFSQCRHIRGCWNSVAEHAHGTRGQADISGAKIYAADGKLIWSGKGGGGGHQEEHHDLFAALRRGEIYNEVEWGAHSTLTAIMGRLGSYSGQVISWDDALNSNLALADVEGLNALHDAPPAQPNRDGACVTEEHYEIAMPGQTRVI